MQRVKIRCENADSYKAELPPRCGCIACEMKWQSAQLGRVKRVNNPYELNPNLVWDAKGAVYGFCPKCGSPGEMRERVDGSGKDRCQNKHVYLSTEAIAKARASR